MDTEETIRLLREAQAAGDPLGLSDPGAGQALLTIAKQRCEKAYAEYAALLREYEQLHGKSLEECIKERQVWLAEEGWVDPLENRPWDAFGYRVVGFFHDEEAANSWVDEGGTFTREDCWAVPEEGADKRRVTLISQIS